MVKSEFFLNTHLPLFLFLFFFYLFIYFFFFSGKQNFLLFDIFPNFEEEKRKFRDHAFYLEKIEDMKNLTENI